jgi:hypothetical protein
MRRHVSPASFFSPSLIPEISLIYDAVTPLGFDLDEFATVAQRWVDDILAPVWGTPARICARQKTRANAWALVFVDTEPHASDDGWHDLTRYHMPMGKVFLRVLKQEKPPASVSLAATHEIAEMLVDPGLTLCTQRPSYGVYSLEVADPVEEEFRTIDGFDMTNFVYPAWYEPFHKRGSTKFDWLDRCSKPFQILPDGYASILRKGRWSDVTLSKRKKKRFAKEDRRGHRTMQRKRAGNLKESTAG